jgi:predicted ester cyclase
MAMTDGGSVDGKALVRAYLEDVFTNGNVAAMDRYLSGDAFKASVAVLVATWRRAFTDFRIVVDDALVDRDKVVTVEILSGTHDGVYDSTVGPIEPTGRTVRWSRIAIRTLEDGRFVKGFFEEDEVGLLLQMGALELVNARAAAHRSTAQTESTKCFRVMDAVGRADPKAVPDDDSEV